jgi:hypothetical protein
LLTFVFPLVLPAARQAAPLRGTISTVRRSPVVVVKTFAALIFLRLRLSPCWFFLLRAVASAHWRCSSTRSCLTTTPKRLRFGLLGRYNDAEFAREHGARALANTSLWSNGGPVWSQSAQVLLEDALGEGEDWEVWFEWYEDRVCGVSRGEAYELVFASVPLAVWRKGPAAGERMDTPASVAAG